MISTTPADHLDAVVSSIDRDYSWLSCTIGGQATNLRVATALLPENAMFGSPVRITVDKTAKPVSLSIVFREVTPVHIPEIDELMEWVESL